MPALPDTLYYRKREQQEQAMARRAASPPIRALHEELAARYHGLAIAAEFNPSKPWWMSDLNLEDSF